MEKLKVDLCPECGSGKVEHKGPAGSIITSDTQAVCNNCGWEGSFSDLVSSVVEDEGGLTADQTLQIAESISQEYLRKISQYAAQQIGIAMVESGIVGTRNVDRLTKLIRAACIGAHKATLEEIERMQKEARSDAITAGN